MSGVGTSNSAQIFTVSESVSPVVTTNNEQQRQQRRFKKPCFDVLVISIGLPSLLILGLMLETMTHENWPQTTQSRLSVLCMGAAFAIICLALCMYVTSRLGSRFLWVGPQLVDEMGSPTYSYYNTRAVDDLPPKYDAIIMTVDDIPPPAYDTLIFENEKQFEDIKKCVEKIAIQHI